MALPPVPAATSRSIHRRAVRFAENYIGFPGVTPVGVGTNSADNQVSDAISTDISCSID